MTSRPEAVVPASGQHRNHHHITITMTQYRIHARGSLGPYLPTQILTEAQVAELKRLEVFDMHLAANRIEPVDKPLPKMPDRSVITQAPIKPVAEGNDPSAAYREVGKPIPAVAQILEQDEVDELEEQLKGLDDEDAAEGHPGGEIDLSDLSEVAEAD